MTVDNSLDTLEVVHTTPPCDETAREMNVLSKTLGFTQVTPIGEGGYGRVYRVLDSLNRPLIAKCSRNPNDQRWPKEVSNYKQLTSFLKSLRTPRLGVPDYLGAFEYDDCSFLFVEYVDGSNLTNLYWPEMEGGKRRKSAVGPIVAARIIRNAATITHALHVGGYLHRDLSSNNIMVDTSGATWVIDFGLSLKMGELRFSETSALGPGTLWFMSPEQERAIRDGWELDARADVYSLGRVLLWLLCESFEVPEKTVKLPEGIDKLLVAICKKATEQQRENRFPDARTFADALNAWLPDDSDDLGKRPVAYNVDQYLEPWQDRLNRCFRSEDEVSGEAKILHVYPEIDRRPTVKYAFAEVEDDTIADKHRPSTDEDKAWYREHCENLQINEIHAVIMGEPDWKSDVVRSRVAFFKEIKFWRHQMQQQRREWPRVLSANPLLFCEKESVVLVHLRSSESATFSGKVEKYLHTFGGGFMPAFGKRAARDDAHDLLLTATRECLEESGLAPSFALDTPAIMCRELQTNFHQLMVFAKPIGKWEYRRVCPGSTVMGDLNKWEGEVYPIPFDQLERHLIDLEGAADAHWVPTGRLHILAWLAMGAPLLRPDKKLFGGKTPWEVYQSVTSAILRRQESDQMTQSH